MVNLIRSIFLLTASRIFTVVARRSFCMPSAEKIQLYEMCKSVPDNPSVGPLERILRFGNIAINHTSFGGPTRAHLALRVRGDIAINHTLVRKKSCARGKMQLLWMHPSSRVRVKHHHPAFCSSSVLCSMYPIING
jgi:hypothetical protein